VSGPTRSTTPAPLTHAVVDGLAVTRRRPQDQDERPSVVLVHGAMDRAASFGRTMRRLGDHQVVAYDRRGYGASTSAGTAGSIAEHAADLAGILDWLDADEVVVVGHSLGGTIAAQLAVAADRRVTAIAAFESPFPLLDDSFDHVGGGAVQVGDDQGPEAAAEHFYRLMVGDQIWARLRERDRLARRAEGPALLAELRDLRRRDRALDPLGVDVPVLVGSGGLSSERMRDGARLLAERLAHARSHVIDTAGHGAHLTHPDEFARYVEATVRLRAADETVG
jgi:pimeloyl-ACP methyl ester carboxylesterase